MLLLLEDRGDICFSPVFRQFSQLLWSKITESGLATTTASCLSNCESTPSGPREFCMYSLLKYSLTWSSSTKGMSSFFQISSWSLQPLKASLASEDWWKKGIQYLRLFHVLCNQLPPPLWAIVRGEPTFSLVFLSLPAYLRKPFLLSFTSPARSNSMWDLAFLTSSLDVWLESLYSPSLEIFKTRLDKVLCSLL